MRPSISGLLGKEDPALNGKFPQFVGILSPGSPSTFSGPGVVELRIKAACTLNRALPSDLNPSSPSTTLQISDNVSPRFLLRRYHHPLCRLLGRICLCIPRQHRPWRAHYRLHQRCFCYRAQGRCTVFRQSSLHRSYTHTSLSASLSGRPPTTIKTISQEHAAKLTRTAISSLLCLRMTSPMDRLAERCDRLHSPGFGDSLITSSRCHVHRK